MNDLLYYPCVIGSDGRIRRKVRSEPVSREEAENVLKREYRAQWLKGEAIPQPITHPYFRS